MANAMREQRVASGAHRADQIGVHHREWWESSWLLLALLGALVVGLLAFWAYGRSRARAPEMGSTNVTAPESPRMTEPEAPMAPAPAVGTAEGMVCDTITLHFDSNAASIGAEDRGSIESLSECLKANPSQMVRVEGRADPREFAEQNTALAQSRAETVASELTSNGVPSSQLSVVTSETTCSEEDESCWQQDRSVTIAPIR